MKLNLERYKKDLDSLIETGNDLFFAIQFECHPEQCKKLAEKMMG
jgi:hypothetical protein